MYIAWLSSKRVSIAAAVWLSTVRFSQRTCETLLAAQNLAISLRRAPDCWAAHDKKTGAPPSSGEALEHVPVEDYASKSESHFEP